jgi:hypothetical protein
VRKPAAGNAIMGCLGTALIGILLVSVTAAWGALLAWGAIWLIWR